MALLACRGVHLDALPLEMEEGLERGKPRMEAGMLVLPTKEAIRSRGQEMVKLSWRTRPHSTKSATSLWLQCDHAITDVENGDHPQRAESDRTLLQFGPDFTARENRTYARPCLAPAELQF